MRSFIKRALAASTILGVPLTVLALCIGTTGAALADGSIETMSGGQFTKFGADVVSSEERAAGRRGSSSSRARSARASSNDQDDTPAPRRRSKGRQVASLGGGEEFSAPRPRRSLSGGGNINWAANSSCLNGTLRSAVAHVAANYGSVTVNSTCRSAGHNAAVGGAPRSYHLSGDAVDLRVHGNISGAASYLASLGGGYKHYGGGLFHVDTGPRRPF
jgi:hypothetical protein